MSDTLSIHVLPEDPPRSIHFWALREVLARVHDDSEMGVAIRERALEVLRREADDAITAFIQARENLAPGDVLGEWAIMWAAGQCHGAGVLQWLHDQAIREVPADLADHDDAGHATTGCDRESDGHVLVRVMATESAATVGDVEAEKRIEALVSIIKNQPHTAVRAAAASAAYDLDDSIRERVAELVAESQRWIADLRKVPHSQLVADTSDLKDPIRLVGRPPREFSDQASYAVPRAGCCECTDQTDPH